MASVGVIYAVRALMSATALKFYALAGSVWALGALVWVARVEENFLIALGGGLRQTLIYLLSAVTETTLAVQLVLVVVLFALGSLALDLVRSVSSQKQLAY